MTRTALALSPHLDDAAFSCGGTLARMARAGWRVVVATVFTRTVPNPRGFALACQLDKGLPAEHDYMALRRDEDRAAMAALGAAPPIHLPFAEAPHRGYGSAAALFGPPLDGDTVTEPLAAALHDLIHAHAPDVVLAPQAIGGHVDHVRLVQALERAVAPVMPVLWWRDFPYVARQGTPAEPFRAALDDLPDHALALGRADVAAREAACLSYASQLGFQFGGQEGLRRALAEAGTVEHLRGRTNPLDGPPDHAKP